MSTITPAEITEQHLLEAADMILRAPGPESEPVEIRVFSSWPCKAEQIAALTDSWRPLSELPGDENSGTRFGQYETLVHEGIAERSVVPIVRNEQTRGALHYYRLAPRVGSEGVLDTPPAKWTDAMRQQLAELYGARMKAMGEDAVYAAFETIKEECHAIVEGRLVGPFPQEPALPRFDPNDRREERLALGQFYCAACSSWTTPVGGSVARQCAYCGAPKEEPAPGSPEAVDQAAETIRELAEEYAWKDDGEEFLISPVKRRYREGDDWRSADPDWMERYIRYELLRLVAERKALAADLETSRLLCGLLADALAVALSAIENLDFAAWERCGHDSEAYREATGTPSLAEAAHEIREALRKAGRL